LFFLSVRLAAIVAVAAATGNVLEFVLSEITHCVLALRLSWSGSRQRLIDLKSGTICNKKFKPI
jgi:hypothetical protein